MKNLPQISSFPVMLEVIEKHDTLHYLLSSEQDLFDISLRILREREKSGYFYHRPDPEAPAVGMTEDQIQSFTDLEVRTALLEVRTAQLREVRQWDRDTKFIQRVDRALASNDGKEAWKILDSRSACEYEKVLVISFDDPERYRI